jgi:hypothetical protein
MEYRTIRRRSQRVYGSLKQTPRPLADQRTPFIVIDLSAMQPDAGLGGGSGSFLHALPRSHQRFGAVRVSGHQFNGDGRPAVATQTPSALRP